MKTISIQISEELHAVYLENERKINDMVNAILTEQLNSKEDRMEMVRVICRAKAPVCNWHDMELQIMKGSI